MAIKMFAAIAVGSFELTMKIFEFSGKNKMRQIDNVRYRLELGKDTYATGKIHYKKVDELCRVLREFKKIMATYKVEEYAAYGTSAIRETQNMYILLDQIYIRTGIRIAVLSNSEQRFLDYKSIASTGEGFNQIIESGTIIVDIGGGSIQISLFDHDSLITTQNMKLGVLRMREMLRELYTRYSQLEELTEEIIGNQLSVFKKLYIKDRDIQNIIVVDDYASSILQKQEISGEQPGFVTREKYNQFLSILRTKRIEEVSDAFSIPEETVLLTFLSAVMLKRLMEVMDAEVIWAPGVTLCDGIAYDYGQRSKLIRSEHNFEQDIVACAQNISKRYMGSKKRGEMLEKIAVTIFDSIQKMHGLDKRERLLLQIAALLHDCGRYITLTNIGEGSFEIIMSTEIIGLSHVERKIIANIVKYNHVPFEYYESMTRRTSLDLPSYLKIAKLTAILRVARGLDRSHKQKFRDLKAILKDDELTITVDTKEDITLERGLFEKSADFFAEVFSIRPVIRQKRTI